MNNLYNRKYEKYKLKTHYIINQIGGIIENLRF
jgi:hypothetical protein